VDFIIDYRYKGYGLEGMAGIGTSKIDFKGELTSPKYDFISYNKTLGDNSKLRRGI
jgi:hypothetical protein